MKIGKLSPEQLQRLVLDVIKSARTHRKTVLTIPEIGQDCAVLAHGYVLSGDPITSTTQHAGRLAVQVNANDVAAAGAEPLGIMLTLLLPPAITEDEIVDVMTEAVREADALNMCVLGGHTEITDAVTRPVVSAVAIGKREEKTSQLPVCAGMDVVMTKYAGLEGTAILTGDAHLATLLCVVPEAKIAQRLGVCAMHDATEGGVLGACYEMAHAHGVGIDVFTDTIPILPETQQICKQFQLDPLKLIASGALLIVTDQAARLLHMLQSGCIHAQIIGKITKNEKRLITKKGVKPLYAPESDEIYKARAR
jgi:hydrogenase maturation factor